MGNSINLKSIVARPKFKESDEKEARLWIVLFNSIKRANLTKACNLSMLEIFYFSLKQLLHGCRQFLFCNIQLILLKDETFILNLNSCCMVVVSSYFVIFS